MSTPTTGSVARPALEVPPVPRSFRADIEGMRAVAVLGVVLWHAGVTLLPGGFTGVDVFFVVSGFLVTGLLLEEGRERGRIALGRFYARRARRLLPAALTALVGTVALALLFLPRARWAELGGDVVASALYVVNWRLAQRSVDYLDTERAPSLLQHYWSLSVEEQFYLLWPVLLGVLLLMAAGRARLFRVLAWSVTGVLLLVSLGLSVRWTAQDPSAYFVTPTRVHELMLGAVVALGVHAWPRLPRLAAAALGWLGLAMVMASLVVIDAGTPFPGAWALLPTGGAALVLLAGPAAGSWGPVLLLRARPLQWLGRLSYSLYLWHWPFVAVAAEVAQVGRGGPAGLPVHWGLLAVAVSVVPAWLSFRYIEEPIRRHGRVLAARLPEPVVTRRTLRLGLDCTVAGVVLGVLMLAAAPPQVTREAEQWRTPEMVDTLRAPVGAGTLEDDVDPAPRTSGAPATGRAATAMGLRVAGDLGEPLPEVVIPQELGELAVPLAQVPADGPVLMPEDCFVGISGTEVGVCRGGDPDGRVTVALIGDSHAAMWMTAMDQIGRDRGWQVVVMSKSSCPPAVGLPVRRHGQAGDYVQCERWQEGLTRQLQQEDPDLVLMSSATYGSVGADPMARALAARVDELAREQVPAALIRDVPRAPFDVPACLVDNPDDVSACAFDRAEAVDRAGTGHAELAAMRPGVAVLDFTDAVCPGRTCSPVIGGVVVWRDSNHLSATYVRSLTAEVESTVVPLVGTAVLPTRIGADLERGAGLGG